jgi:Helicase associated domain
MIFKQREHHCLVPQEHFESDYDLGAWVSRQRTKKREGALSATRIARLEAQGFEWRCPLIDSNPWRVDNHEAFVGIRLRVWRKQAILESRHEVDVTDRRYSTAAEYFDGG